MAIQTFPAVPTADVERKPPPPLENGDHLTAAEFWERYVAMPEEIHAELIEGVVFMASPIQVKRHSHSNSVIVGWLSVYEAATPLAQSSSGGTVRLDADNTVEPDAFLRIEAAAGGQSRIGGDDYLDGAPELVVEIAASTISRDLHEKKRAYRRNGVQEYIVWRARDRALDWFRLRGGKYERVEPEADGILRSQVFPGLRLAVDKLLNGDFAGVLAELQKGIATPEHAAFVEKLAAQQ